MRVALGKFACSGIEAQLGSDLAAGVRSALLHYLARLEAGWRPPEYPYFLRCLPQEPIANLELHLDAEAQAALQREVLRNGAPIEQVAAQAVLVYLAYLDEAAGTNYV